MLIVLLILATILVGVFGIVGAFILLFIDGKINKEEEEEKSNE